MKKYLAIDPGVSGGIAFNLETGGVNVKDKADAMAMGMPATDRDIIDELRLICEYDDKIVAIIEDVPKYVGNNVPGSSIFPLAYNVGFVRAALMTMNVPVILVKPQDWQKHFRLGTKKDAGSTTAWKNKLKGEAQRRHPHLKVTLKTADSLLLLDFARESSLG